MKSILGSIFLWGFCASLNAQLIIDTVAGGVIRSGVPAQEVLLETVGGMALDPQGNIVFAESSRHVIRRIRPDGVIETIAGTGVSGYGGDGGPATSALLWYPTFLQFDAAGNLYFADSRNYRIRRIDTSGNITTLAGTGIPLMTDDAFSSPRIGQILGMAVDPSGVIYFSESTFGTPTLSIRQQVRKRDLSGTLDLVAGTGTNDIPDTGIPAISAAINSPGFLAIDGAGDLYLANVGQIIAITPDGTAHKFAGFHGPSASPADGPAITVAFQSINSLAADPYGNVYLADGALLRRIGTDGNVTTLSGSRTGSDPPDGPALNAHLVSAAPLATDGHGNVYFCDFDKIREVTSALGLTTLSGESPKPVPDGTPAMSAWFLNPQGYSGSLLAIGPDGAVYIAEQYACLVRRIGNDGLLATVAGTGHCATSPSSGAALSVDLPLPVSIAVDANSTIYLGVGAGLLTIASGQISIVNGISATTMSVAVDSKGRVYAASGGNLARYSAAAGIESLGSWLIPYRISFVTAVQVDGNDNVYVAGYRNSVGAIPIVRFTPAGSGTALNSLFAPFQVSSIAFIGSSVWYGAYSLFNSSGRNPAPYGGFSGDGAPLASSGVGVVGSIAASPTGDLLLFDSSSNRIRKVTGALPAQKPVILKGGIVNAASLHAGPIAPGELIAIFGSNLGPASLQLPIDVNNTIPSVLGNVQVTFYGSPGAIAAAVSGQVNVFVPYDLAGQTSTAVTVVIDGVSSDPVTVPVAASAFALVSADGSGSGQGAIVNQDGSLNVSAPAPRGSVVTLYGTGEGLITPLIPTGSFSVSTPFSNAVSPVSVTIGGQPAEVLYSGEAPFEPVGVFQINARVPQSISPGSASVVVTVGNIASAANITVSVE